MCGICGILRFDIKNIQESELTTMMDSIKHRGPDDQGYFIDNNTGIGHVRLSIIDLSESGHQPMFSDDSRYVIVFNGEIYNFQEIRKELSPKFTFKSNSDTEVILNAFIEWNQSCLNKFRGMFSFVIYDKLKKEIFAARDRFGIKPFYYYIDNEKFIFASEIKAILVNKDIKPIINEVMLFDFMVYNRTDHDVQTCFKNIYNLRPGHSLTLNKDNKINIKKWYSLPEITKKSQISEAEATQNLYDLIDESIKLHLISDVPVGSALSGGLDSSSIICMMRKILGSSAQINSFSAVYSGDWEKNEKKYIDEVVKFSNINSCFTFPDADKLLNSIQKLIYFQEEPFGGTSIFAGWSVMNLAKEHNAKVLLNGQGSDEIFAYDYMAAFYFYELLTKCKPGKLFKEVSQFLSKQKYGNSFTFQLFGYLLTPDFLKKYVVQFGQPWISKNFYNSYIDESHFFQDFFDVNTLNTSVKNHLLYKLNHLLRFEDKNSMAFSIETRVPFLDHKLVEFALNIPSEFKVKNGEVKYILKQAMKPILPTMISERNNKIGFETPQNKWFKNANFIKLVDNVFNSANPDIDKFVNKKYILKHWQDFKDKKHNQTMTIWKYFNLNLWYIQYFQNN